MRRLLLMRHAKAARGGATGSDYERPLDDRGWRAAVLVGAHLERSGARVDALLCSAARRTRETCEALALAWRAAPVPVPIGDLYLAEPAALLATLRQLGDAPRAAMLVGHNPGVHALADALCGGGDRAAQQRLRDRFPTAALADLRFDSPWSGLRRGCARLESFVAPRDLV